ncbi:hypothetical protein BC830DRAFT_1165752 [Chytriomyces sp. MP71]|nr:hypothetical protein BC830DRAFT_1165752 [Chytriomyces sp. MP71]
MLVNVHSGSKVKDCVETALNHLKSALEVDGTPVAGEESRKASITLRAKDKAISKVISVVEIVKREFGPTKLSQTTEISYYQPNASAVARQAGDDSDGQEVENVTTEQIVVAESVVGKRFDTDGLNELEDSTTEQKDSAEFDVARRDDLFDMEDAATDEHEAGDEDAEQKDVAKSDIDRHDNGDVQYGAEDADTASGQDGVVESMVGQRRST